MPNLLSLNTYHYRRGGTDAVYFDHMALFEGIGWDTACMAMKHPDNEPSAWSGYFANEIEFGSDYSALEKITMAGKVIYSLEARKKLDRLLDAWQPDIAHAHNLYHHLSPSVLGALKKRNIPTVLTAHDFKLACPAYKMFNQKGLCERCKNGNLLNVAIHRCVRESFSISSLIAIESTVHRLLGLYRNYLDRIVVPSRFLLNKLVEWGWPKQSLVHIPNFVHLDRYQPDYEPGDYFVYFGRLAREKGVDILIRAAAETGVRVRILGTGPEQDRLKELAGKASGKIEFMGFRSGEELKSLVRGARAMVLPARWYENAPISIMEAYALGKPVLGANIGGIPEMIIDGETGYLFEPEDEKHPANLMAQVAAMPDPELVSMGKSARAYVSATFTPQRYLENMLELYQKLGVSIDTKTGMAAS